MTFFKWIFPECLNRGSSPTIRLDSRLKHAGMTDFVNNKAYSASWGELIRSEGVKLKMQ
jgi:hypothetical protein